MKLYKKYLIENLFKPLIVSLATLVVIIWSSRAIRFMDLVVEDGAEFSSFFKITLLILPSLVLIVLPLTVFLTAILTYAKLIENREIVIIKNCGVKKNQILSPLIILSIFTAFFAYSISLYGSYKSNLMIRELKQEIQNNISFSMVKEGTFVKFKNVTIYVDKKKDDKAFNILIYREGVKKEDEDDKKKKIKENKDYTKTDEDKKDEEDMTQEDQETEENTMEDEEKDKENVKEKKNFLLQAQMAEINGNIITLYNGNFQQFGFDYKQSPEIMFFDKYCINLNDLISEDNTSIYKTDSISTLKLIYIFKNYNEYKKFFPNKNKIIYEINYRLTFPLLSIVMALLSGSLMLEATFNRVSNTKLLLKTSIISGSTYIVLLSLYQKIADDLVYMYILYICIIIVLLISFRLMKEKKVM